MVNKLNFPHLANFSAFDSQHSQFSVLLTLGKEYGLDLIKYDNNKTVKSQNLVIQIISTPSMACCIFLQPLGFCNEVSKGLKKVFINAYFDLSFLKALRRVCVQSKVLKSTFFPLKTKLNFQMTAFFRATFD